MLSSNPDFFSWSQEYYLFDLIIIIKSEYDSLAIAYSGSGNNIDVLHDLMTQFTDANICAAMLNI